MCFMSYKIGTDIPTTHGNISFQDNHIVLIIVGIVRLSKNYYKLCDCDGWEQPLKVNY